MRDDTKYPRAFGAMSVYTDKALVALAAIAGAAETTLALHGEVSEEEDGFRYVLSYIAAQASGTLDDCLSLMGSGDEELVTGLAEEIGRRASDTRRRGANVAREIIDVTRGEQ